MSSHLLKALVLCITILHISKCSCGELSGGKGKGYTFLDTLKAKPLVLPGVSKCDGSDGKVTLSGKGIGMLFSVLRGKGKGLELSGCDPSSDPSSDPPVKSPSPSPSPQPAAPFHPPEGGDPLPPASFSSPDPHITPASSSPSPSPQQGASPSPWSSPPASPMPPPQSSPSPSPAVILPSPSPSPPHETPTAVASPLPSPPARQSPAPQRSPGPQQSPAPRRSPTPQQSPAPQPSPAPQRSPKPQRSPAPRQSPAPKESPPPLRSARGSPRPRRNSPSPSPCIGSGCTSPHASPRPSPRPNPRSPIRMPCNASRCEAAAQCEYAATCELSTMPGPVRCPPGYRCKPISNGQVCLYKYKPSSSVCHKATGACDRDVKCSGESGQCPLGAGGEKRFKPAGTVCREAAGNCGAVSSCTGRSVECPPPGSEGRTGYIYQCYGTYYCKGVKKDIVRKHKSGKGWDVGGCNVGTGQETFEDVGDDVAGKAQLAHFQDGYSTQCTPARCPNGGEARTAVFLACNCDLSIPSMPCNWQYYDVVDQVGGAAAGICPRQPWYHGKHKG